MHRSAVARACSFSRRDGDGAASKWKVQLSLWCLNPACVFREIGEQLNVTRNTIKTQAIAVYRKLGVSSRNDAIDRAAELGLLDAAHGTARS